MLSHLCHDHEPTESCSSLCSPQENWQQELFAYTLLQSLKSGQKVQSKRERETFENFSSWWYFLLTVDLSVPSSSFLCSESVRRRSCLTRCHFVRLWAIAFDINTISSELSSHTKVCGQCHTFSKNKSVRRRSCLSASLTVTSLGWAHFWY